MTLWLVRCGSRGEGENYAFTNNVVGIGWPELGDLSAVHSLEAVKQRLGEQYPDAKQSRITNWAGQIDAFTRRIKEGDLVALPLKTAPAVAFGRVRGGYRFDVKAPEQIRHQRSVQWIREDIPRSEIDQDLLFSLGAYMTVCQIKRNNAEKRIEALLAGKPAVESAPHKVPSDEGDGSAPVDFDRLSRDQISKRIAARFNGHELAQLVGEILRAEGFVTSVSPAGPDGGVDILAGQGSMGFDGAMLAVQVKSGAQQADAPYVARASRCHVQLRRLAWPAGELGRVHQGSSRRGAPPFLPDPSVGLRRACRQDHGGVRAVARRDSG